MSFYLVAVIVLFALAIGDLIVGVSNDAVNFLNSAVGSKVARRRTIMIVASLGVFVGATFSSGMMEIARKGIFNPQFFQFSEIMIIFLAVMITDIILLDLFNTFGLPTSTTVSIVFELLGAAVVVSLLKISAAGQSMSDLVIYINSGKALAIISGIFISVGVAFFVGVIVMAFSRLLFSFELEKRTRYVGALWSGFALTAMSYFLLIKGIKGASFATPEFVTWIGANTWSLLATLLVVWCIVAQVLMLLKVNVFRIVVLVGTFALAMAFAGNDLVNFIGVPIAGFESYLDWSASGVAADQHTMTALTEPVRTQTWMLLIAGIIMVATLWRSKKAQSVTETEVNLGRQGEGTERFQPNEAARVTVRFGLWVGQAITRIVPARMKAVAHASFQDPSAGQLPDPEKPAFDLIRASVNLATASVLIALATSLQLPLSTTYVSFMVAMGTSLADRAWGRDSAVYRISGVFNVIGGWFLTAIVAAGISGLFALILFKLSWFGLILLLGVVGLSLARGIYLFRRRQASSALATERDSDEGTVARQQALEEIGSKSTGFLLGVSEWTTASIAGLVADDRKQLRQASKQLTVLEDEVNQFGQSLPSMIRKAVETGDEISRSYVQLFDYSSDLLQSAALLNSLCEHHVSNHLKPLAEEQAEALSTYTERVAAFLATVEDLEAGQPNLRAPHFQAERDVLVNAAWTLHADQVKGLKDRVYRKKATHLLLRVLLELKDIVAISHRIGILKTATPDQVDSTLDDLQMMKS